MNRHEEPDWSWKFTLLGVRFTVQWSHDMWFSTIDDSDKTQQEPFVMFGRFTSKDKIRLYGFCLWWLFVTWSKLKQQGDWTKRQIVDIKTPAGPVTVYKK